MGVVKLIELVGTSPNSWEEATSNAVKEAAKTVRGITRVLVNGLDAKVEDGKIVEYRADVRLSFRVER
jgi:hypothetical protein